MEESTKRDGEEGTGFPLLSFSPPSFELRFCGDFCSPSRAELGLRNEGGEAVLFKVKTTSPHRYLVKPHRGRVPPRSSMSVSVVLLPFPYRRGVLYKDKFLVQACIHSKLNEDYVKHDYWSMVPKGELLTRRFKCSFDYVPPPLPSKNRNKSSGTDSKIEAPTIEVEEEEDEVFEAEEASEKTVAERLEEARAEVDRLEAAKDALERRNKELTAEIGRLRRQQQQAAKRNVSLEEGRQDSRGTPVWLRTAVAVLALAFIWTVIEKILTSYA